MKNKTTRRAIVAGLPVATGAVSGDDPAITAIVEYRRCYTEYEAAVEANSRCFKEAREALGVVTYAGTEVHSLVE
jgi:hypothetical protein